MSKKSQTFGLKVVSWDDFVDEIKIKQARTKRRLAGDSKRKIPAAVQYLLRS